MLTAKEENFCLCIASGETQIDAYKHSYNADKMSDKVCCNKASLLMQKGDIRVRIDELRKESRSDRIINTIQKKELLTEWIYDADTSKTDRLKALDILNKMDGEYTEKIEAKQEVKISIDSDADSWGK